MELTWTNTIEEVTRRIIATVQPQRILLFGSAARDQMNMDSDLDFLVIVRGPAHRRALVQEIYRNLHGILTPVDVVVVTEQDVRRHGKAIGSILRPALREGKVIYERSQ
jgi:predicted nucleotidyltransferase